MDLEWCVGNVINKELWVGKVIKNNEWWVRKVINKEWFVGKVMDKGWCVGKVMEKRCWLSWSSTQFCCLYLSAAGCHWLVFQVICLHF